MPTYVVELAFDKDNDHRMEVRPSHREYLQKLHAEGRLVTAGPFADDTGALLVTGSAAATSSTTFSMPTRTRPPMW
ncbi:MAG: YciI family protein [Jiangellaceae bacterium]